MEKQAQKKEKIFTAREIEYHPAVKNREQIFPIPGSESCIIIQRKWNKKKDLKLNFVPEQLISEYRGRDNQLIRDEAGKSVSVEIDAHWHNPKYIGGAVLNQFAFIDEEAILGQEGYFSSQLVIEKVTKHWYMADKILKNLDNLTAKQAVEKFRRFAIAKIKPVVSLQVWAELQKEIFAMRKNSADKETVRDLLRRWKFKACYYNLNYFPTSKEAVLKATEAGKIYQTKLRPGKILKDGDEFHCCQKNPFKDIEATIAVEPAPDYLIKQLRDYLRSLLS